jgi:hypothetical protein
MLIRQLVSILVLPFTIAVLVPWWIARRGPVAVTRGSRRIRMIDAWHSLA